MTEAGFGPRFFDSKISAFFTHESEEWRECSLESLTGRLGDHLLNMLQKVVCMNSISGVDWTWWFLRSLPRMWFSEGGRDYHDVPSWMNIVLRNALRVKNVDPILPIRLNLIEGRKRLYWWESCGWGKKTALKILKWCLPISDIENSVNKDIETEVGCSGLNDYSSLVKEEGLCYR